MHGIGMQSPDLVVKHIVLSWHRKEDGDARGPCTKGPQNQTNVLSQNRHDTVRWLWTALV